VIPLLAIRRQVACVVLVSSVVGVSAASAAPADPADLLVVGGRVYTFTWDEPSLTGTPAANAPHSAAGWRPDAEAVAIRGDRIVFVGSTREVQSYRGPRTRVLDVRGATVIPGLVDAHTHVAGLGESLSRVDLRGVATPEQAIERVAAFAARVPKGQWVVGRGWDEGAWANHYPDMKRLSERLPDHPVFLQGLHSFAAWGNRLAFEKAGITRDTKAPEGGEIVKDAAGNPSGILLNQAVSLLASAVPPTTDAQLKDYVRLGLERMARDGYVAVHEAGVDARLLAAFQSLESEGKLPVRVYLMLGLRDPALCRTWLSRGPLTDPSRRLVIRSVKAFEDGALGSRGARLLEDYSDRPGHRGVTREGYGFDRALMADMIRAGFQAAIHAIGDAGNRDTLDFLASVASREARHRIEHAQVLHPDDIPRFARLGVIASMQPPHCAEDKAWAEARLGPVRVRGGYAWRSLRASGARLVFSSDLIGSDHDIFYGLHSAITRRDKERQPAGGWYPEQRMTAEEAVRGYTTWAAYSSFWEKETGLLASGRWADLTVLDIDPLALGESDPGRLLDGHIRATIVAGRVLYESALK
jgi:predicted amidohydrolase YtcJ